MTRLIDLPALSQLVQAIGPAALIGQLAEAIKADLPYHISCPALLICGEKDKAGSAQSYNKKWHQREGLPLKWIKNAGHNSNTDQPDEVNRLIEKFISEVDRRGVPR